MDQIIGNLISAIINPIIIILAAIAFLYFIWGLFLFIAGADDETKRKEGRNHIFYGIIGLSIIVGAWGIIRFLDAVVDDIDTTNSESALDIYEGR